MTDREAFEAWASMNVSQPDFGGYHTDGGAWFYRHNFIRMCWDAWQAAIASERREAGRAVREALLKFVEPYDANQLGLTRNFKISDAVRAAIKEYE